MSNQQTVIVSFTVKENAVEKAKVIFNRLQSKTRLEEGCVNYEVY